MVLTTVPPKRMIPLVQTTLRRYGWSRGYTDGAVSGLIERYRLLWRVRRARPFLEYANMQYALL